MNDEKKLKVWKLILKMSGAILVCITLALQICAFEVSKYGIFCSFILLILTVILVIDAFLKEYKEIAKDGILYTMWFIMLILNFCNF